MDEARLTEQVAGWVRNDAQGSSTLAAEGLRRTKNGEEASSVAELLRTLQRVKALRRVSGDPEEKPRLQQQPLPPQMEHLLETTRFYKQGPLSILRERMDEPPSYHLSISYPGRWPTWVEISRAADAVAKDHAGGSWTFWAWPPPPEREASVAARVVHLYTRPPEELMQ